MEIYSCHHSLSKAVVQELRNIFDFGICGTSFVTKELA